MRIICNHLVPLQSLRLTEHCLDLTTHASSLHSKNAKQAFLCGCLTITNLSSTKDFEARVSLGSANAFLFGLSFNSWAKQGNLNPFYIFN